MIFRNFFSFFYVKNSGVSGACLLKIGTVFKMFFQIYTKC